MVERVIVASPRGFCAGVVRAIDTVEEALEKFGPPVYVRRQIVHNEHVIRDLEQRGAIFVESETDVPEGATLVLAAHGVAPAVYRRTAGRSLRTIDATCPLVKKVHAETNRFVDAGYHVVVIGHAGHDEVVGTIGQAPDSTVLVETVEQARVIDLPDGARVAYVTQTTLSVNETAQIVATLRARFPEIAGPHRNDICYATENRQNAVTAMAAEVGLVLVVGSTASSNSNRLVETAEAAGTPAYLVPDDEALEERLFDGVDAVGVTAGASTPEALVLGVLSWFRDRGVSDIRSLGVISENVSFRLPAEVA
jgi:4-hydroxy-3-methylbut-2-en-1-yl diphosphate reductase